MATTQPCYVVERLVDPEAEIETTRPMSLVEARATVERTIGHRGAFEPDMVRLNLGEVEAWRNNNGGRWVVIRRATALEVAEAS